jgi:hypothetical protein
MNADPYGSGSTKLHPNTTVSTLNETATTEVENRTSPILLMMLALTQMLGAAKVAELEDPTVRVQQQVLGLDIPKLYHANTNKIFKQLFTI